MSRVEASTVERSSSRRLAGAVVVGSALEWYDFLLYGAMSALVFAELFFPSGDAAAASIYAFSVFAVGYVARPLGGIIFGMIGDRLGRKIALVGTFVLMGATSTAIGLLPTYQQAGLLAPILLLVLRLLQGAGAGAEFGIASVYAVEHAATGSRGLVGALPAIGVLLGQILSTLVLRIVAGISGQEFIAWAWRVPFILSLVLVGVGLWIRASLSESPEFDVINARKGRVSLLGVLSQEWRSVAGIFGAQIAFATHASFYVVFSLFYIDRTLGLGRETALQSALFGALASLCMIPIGGWLADRVGARACYVGALSAAALTSALFFPLVNTRDVALVYVAVMASTAIVGFALAAQGSLFSAQFPPQVRASGFLLGREVSTAIFSGISPVLATLLYQAGGYVAVSCYTVGVCLVSIVATLTLLRERRD
jgi:MFS transporter, MHS family, shikimate and dehydroshikimate transport protein